MSKVINFTQAGVSTLPLGSGIWRDEQVKGLLVVCHSTTRTYAAQGDVRRHGRLVRTVRVKIDRCDRMGLREARRRAKEIMSKIQSGVDPTAGPESSGVTLSEMLERYVQDRDLAERTVENYRYHLSTSLWRWKNRAVADISREEVIALNDDLRRKSGLTTSAHVMRTLRALINEAMRIDESITKNPVNAIRIPPPRRREVSEIDLVKWWQRVNELSPVRRDLHILMMFTGLRRRSACSMQRAGVMLDKRIARIGQMKSRRPFLLPLSDFLGDLLRKRMADDEPVQSEWLWPSPHSTTGHAVELRAEGLPGPHEYRHLYRTFSIAAGVPYLESAMLLDHRLPGASFQYIHAEHLANHLRGFQQQVTDYLIAEAKIERITTPSAPRIVETRSLPAAE